MRRCAALLLVPALLGLTAPGGVLFGAGPSTLNLAEGFQVQGVVRSSSNEQLDGLRVEFQSECHTVYRTVVGHDGTFTTTPLPTGPYRLLVKYPNGVLIHTTTVSIDSNTRNVEVILPARQEAEAGTGGTISLTRLEHKVPKKARKQYSRAEAAIRDGRSTDAIARLDAALAIDKDYFKARMLLGYVLLDAGQAEKSLEQFEYAARLDPSSAEALYETSLVLIILKRYDEAVTAAEAALRYDPTAFQAHFALGLAELRLGRITAETVENLQFAASSYPRARLSAAEALQSLDRQEEAAAEVRQYLASESIEASQRAEAQEWLAWIEHSNTTTASKITGSDD